MESSCIVFVLLPFPSHYFACFSYARQLQRNGYSVIFATSGNRRRIVENEGFPVFEITYITEYSITSGKVFIALLLKSLLDKAELIRRFREWRRAIDSIQRMLQVCNPAKVFIDDHLADYYPIIQPICSNVEIINTKLSTKKSVGFPPLNSSFIPRPNLLSKFVCEVLWYRHLFGKAVGQALIRLALLNRDEDYFVERFAGQNGINFRNLVDRRNCFYRSVKNLSVCILAPPGLEFPQRRLKQNERYLDMPVNRNEEYLCTPEYDALLNEVRLQRAKNKKVIYCAFGTLSHAHQDRVAFFINRLFQVVQEASDWILIFSTAGMPFSKTADQIILVDQVPQLDLLQYCDLMISHGGLTSIKECLQQKVQMLIYPLNEKMDQKGNAARVFYHGLGLRGNISTDTPSAIRKKIQLALSDTKLRLVDTASPDAVKIRF